MTMPAPTWFEQEPHELRRWAIAAAVVIGFLVVLRRQEKKFESQLSEDVLTQNGETKLETTEHP